MLSETEKYKLSIYTDKKLIHSSNCDIYLIQSSIDSKLYIKRIYKNSNMLELFGKIKDSNVRNIPQIYEIFYDGQNTTVIEQYIPGHTAESVNFSKGLLFSTIERVLCSAEDLHKINIIHRDIKPENIIIAEDFKAYLTDFGISRFYCDNVDSDTGKLGTKGFASPEQYGFQQTDFRSDIFSIGKTLESIIKTNNLSCNLKTVISKSTSFDPKDRYGSAAEMKRAIYIRRFAPLAVCFFALVCILAAVIGFIIAGRSATSVNSPHNTETTTVSSLTETEKISESTTVSEVAETTTIIETTELTTSAAKITTSVSVPKTTEPSTRQQTQAVVEEITQSTTETEGNINIFNIKQRDPYFDSVSLFIDENYNYMEMLKDETHKTCSITINGTRITAECIKNNSDLTVNFSDDKGNKGSMSMSFTPEQLEVCDFPDDHGFNAYIIFTTNFGDDDGIDIFVNFTDAVQPDTVGGIPAYYYYEGKREPYIIGNWNLLRLVEHSTENGFLVYDGVMTTTWSFFILERDINCQEDMSYYTRENGSMVKKYM